MSSDKFNSDYLKICANLKYQFKLHVLFATVAFAIVNLQSIPAAPIRTSRFAGAMLEALKR